MISLNAIGWIILAYICIRKYVLLIIEDVHAVRVRQLESTAVKIPEEIRYMGKCRYISSKYKAYRFLRDLGVYEPDQLKDRLSNHQIRAAIDFMPFITQYIGGEERDRYVDILTVALFERTVLKQSNE